MPASAIRPPSRARPHPGARHRQARSHPRARPRRSSPRAASSSRRSPTSPAPPGSRPGPSTSTSAARTTCSSRSSSARCVRRSPRAAPRSTASTIRAQRLTRIARLHLERLGRDRDLAVVFQVELRQSTKFMEQFSSTYLRDYLGLIRETIAAGQQARVFRTRDQSDDCRQGLLRRARRDGDQLDPEQAPLLARLRSRCGRRSLRRWRRHAGRPRPERKRSPLTS